ncbi:hypothetical protein [Yonghaparkia sp. Root332]|uniref:hypothetical protein n=1 Tax=Yonghaparkia sp. Root332 TaxID=1736516 RepID=UPI0006F1F93A|nr:hypothetical protein [Yonghaparkia sp. Root332]KQV24842.1 hypothetical protein ASC54_10105 [Yonghaparkia sp. Root332]
MSEHDIHQDDTTMGQNPGAEGDFGAGQGQEGQSADVATGHPTGTDQPRADEVIHDDMDAAGEDEPIPGIDDSAQAGLLTTPNDYDEGQTLTGQADDGVENNFDEGQAGGGVPGNQPGHDGHGGAHS